MIDRSGVHSKKPFPKQKKHCCIFEFIYFSRPDSYIFGKFVDTKRRNLGRQLARLHPVEADIVISVPDSSNTAALGLCRRSGYSFRDRSLSATTISDRTFINPSQVTREHSVPHQVQSPPGACWKVNGLLWSKIPLYAVRRSRRYHVSSVLSVFVKFISVSVHRRS